MDKRLKKLNNEANEWRLEFQKGLKDRLVGGSEGGAGEKGVQTEALERGATRTTPSWK